MQVVVSLDVPWHVAPMSSVTFRLFVYGTLLEGEVDHPLLAGAKSLGAARTFRGYALVEMRALAGLIESGDGEVVGELYEIGYDTLRACDLAHDIPALFQRREVRLSDGSVAEAYLVGLDQARGLRRLRGGDWRARFATARPEPGALVRWARGRHGR